MTNLTTLAAEINTAHSAAVSAARSALEQAKVCGDLLMRAKALQTHGTWLPWLAANCPDITPRTAQGYMRIASRWDELHAANTQRVSHLPIRDALRLLAAPEEKAEIVAFDVPANSVMYGRHEEAGIVREAWIIPHTDPDFVFVNIMTTRPGTDGCWLDGTKRAIRRERGARMAFTMLKFPAENATWTVDEAVGSWAYNQMMFDSHEHYMATCVLGQGASNPSPSVVAL